MQYIISAQTDIGTKKSTNQDSFLIKTVDTDIGKTAFAVLCDGMGGLSSGEIASTMLLDAFDKWFLKEFSVLCRREIEDHEIRKQWEALVYKQNKSIMRFGDSKGIQLGTTVTALLITGTRYYILNVGDTRAYELSDDILQLTEDHTVVSREVKLGNLSYENSLDDPRRNILLQCVGVSDELYPEMYFGRTKANTIYMLCTDGFRNKITRDEIYSNLNPGKLADKLMMQESSKKLIELNKQRNEDDNITVLLIRTL